jgi:hypothetical protein
VIKSAIKAVYKAEREDNRAEKKRQYKPRKPSEMKPIEK